MLRTTNFNLPYFTDGEFFSEAVDEERSVAIDHLLKAFSDVIGDGVISGWEINDDGGLTITVTEGRGFINKLYSRTINDTEETLDDNSTSYIYAVRNSNITDGVSAASNVVLIDFSDYDAPDPPDAFSTEEIESRRILLSWSPSEEPDFSGYVLERKESSSTVYDELTDVPAVPEDDGKVYYEDTDVSPGIAYDYRLSAVDSSGNQGLYSELSVSALDDVVPPPEVSEFVVHVSNRSFSSYWEPVDVDDFDSCVVVFNKINDSGSAVTSSTINVGDNLYYSKNELTNNTTYRITVKTKDIYGNISSGVSQDFTPVYLPGPLDVSGVTFSVTNIGRPNPITPEVTLNWVASSSSDVVGYNIYVIDDGVYSEKISVGNKVSKDVFLYTIRSNTVLVNKIFDDKKDYIVKITAEDSLGKESSGAYVKVFVPDFTPPNDVINFRAGIGDTELNLTWDSSDSLDFDHYELHSWRVADEGSFRETVTYSSFSSNTFTLSSPLTKDFSAGSWVDLVAAPPSGSPSIKMFLATAAYIGDTILVCEYVPPYYASAGQLIVTDPPSFIEFNSRNSYDLTGLTNGVSYRVTIIAVDSSDIRSGGIQVTASPVEEVFEIENPDVVTYDGNNGEVKLSWSEVSGVGGYVIYRTGPFPWEVDFAASDDFNVLTVVSDPSQTTISDVGLSNGVRYSYMVVSYLGAQEGDFDIVNQVIALPTETSSPSSPTNLTAVSMAGAAELSWNIPLDISAIEGWNIYRSTNRFYGYEFVDSVPFSITSYIDEGLINNVQYYYYVRSFSNTVDINVSLSQVTSDTALYLGRVQTAGGDIISVTPNRSVIFNLEKTVQALTEEYLAVHRHSASAENEFSSDRVQPLKINLSRDEDVFGFTTEDYQTYDAPKSIESYDDYVVLINDDLSPILYDVDFSRGRIIFEKVLFSSDENISSVFSEAPSITLRYLNKREVTGTLDPRFISDIDASKIITGKIKKGLLPEISHRGRVRENAEVKRYTMVSQNNYLYDFSVTTYVVDGEDVTISIGNPTVFYAFYDVDEILYGSSNRGILKSSDDGITWEIVLELSEVPRMFYKQIGSEEFYFAIGQKTVYVSSDFLNWFEMFGTKAASSIHDMTEDGDGNIYIAADTGVYFYDQDFILSYNFKPTSLITVNTISSEAHSVIGTTGSNVIVSTEDGIFRTSNKGVSWSQISSFGPLSKMRKFGSKIIAIHQDSGLLYSSSDSGVTWAEVSGFSGMIRDGVFEIIGSRIIYSTDIGVYYSDSLGTPVKIQGDFNSSLDKHGARGAFGTSSSDIIISFDNKIYRYKDGQTYVWAYFSGSIPSVFVDGTLMKNGYYYNSSLNNLYLEWKSLYDQKLKIATGYSGYVIDNGGWQDIDSDDVSVELFVNGETLGSILSSDVESANIVTDSSGNITNKKYVFYYGATRTIIVNSSDGKVEIVGPELEKEDEINVSINNVSFINEGSNGHIEIEDALDKKNIGLPHCLANVYLDSMLQMGLASEHNFIESVQTNTTYPYASERIVRSFNSELINSDFFIFGRKFYDVFNSTIDYDNIESNDDLVSSSTYINVIKEIGDETWICTDKNIFVLNYLRNDVDRKIYIESSDSFSVTGVTKIGDEVYAVASDEVYSSSNNGAVWTKNKGFGLDGKLFEIASLRNLIVVSSDSGIYYSTPDSETWQRASFLSQSGSSVEIDSNIDSLVVFGFGFCLASNKIYRSLNGIIWREIFDLGSLGISGIIASELYVYVNNIYVATNKGLYNDFGTLKFLKNSNLYKVKLDSPDSSPSIKSLSGYGERFVVVGGKNSLYISENYGETWTEQTVSVVGFCDIVHIWQEIKLTSESISLIQNDGVSSSTTSKLSPILDFVYADEDALDSAISSLLTDVEYSNSISSILSHARHSGEDTELISTMADVFQRGIFSTFDFLLTVEENDIVFGNELRQPIEISDEINKVSLYLSPTKYESGNFSVTLVLYGADGNGNINTGPLSVDIKDSDEIFNPGWYNFRISYSGSLTYGVLVLTQSDGDNNNLVRWAYSNTYSMKATKNSVAQDYSYNFILWKFVDAVDVDGQYAESLPAVDKSASPSIGSGTFKWTKLEDSKVKLDADDKLVTVIVDESGSMTWNDSAGSRFDLIREYSGDLNSIYPGTISYALVTYGGKVLNQIKTQIVNDSERDAVGGIFRVIRRTDRYPEHPLDGSVVASTSLTVAQDSTVTSGTTYYYSIFNIRNDTIYSEKQYDKIEVNVRSVPLPVSNLQLETSIVKETIGTPAAAKDTGKRNVNIRFNNIENYLTYYSSVRIVRKKCFDDGTVVENANDGDIVYEGVVIAGENNILDDFGGTSDPINGIDYCYAIFTKNDIGNYCLPENAVQSRATIPSVWREWEYDSAYNSTYIPSEFSTTPLDVENFQVENGYEQNRISWTIPSGDTSVGVVLYASERATPQADALSFAHQTAIKPETTAASSSNAIISDSSIGVKIYEGDGSSFMHRNLENDRKYFYRIYTYDRVSTLSLGNTVGEGIPSDTEDDDFPPPKTKDFYAEIFNDENIVLRWNFTDTEPLIKYYFDDRITVQSFAIDESGIPISEINDFEFEVVEASRLKRPYTEFESAGNENEAPLPEAMPPQEYLFVPDRNSYQGEIRGLGFLFLNDLTSISEYEYYQLKVRSKYSLASTESDSSFISYGLNSNIETITFNNPLSGETSNKFPETQKIANQIRFVGSDGYLETVVVYSDGLYSRSGKSYFGEIDLLYKGAALTDNDEVTVTAQVYGFKGYKRVNEFLTVRIWNDEPTDAFPLASNEIEIVTEEVQKKILVGEDTKVSSETELRTYGTFQLLPTDDSALLNIVFSVNVNGYTDTFEHVVEIKSILNLSLNAIAPIADGRDVAEQTVSAYIGPPTFDLRSKVERVPVPDGVLVKWELEDVLYGQDRPFYSAESIPLEGVYSTVRSGTARNVFFGPASDVKIHYVINSKTGLPEVIGEKYSLKASAVYDGLSAQVTKEIVLMPISSTGTSYRFFMTNGGLIDGESIYADGIASSIVQVHGNPLVTAGDAGEKFIDCLQVQDMDFIPLPPGQEIQIEDITIEVEGEYEATYIYNGVEYSNITDIVMVLDDDARAQFEIKVNANVGPPPRKKAGAESGGAESLSFNPCYGLVPPDEDYPPKFDVAATSQTIIGGTSITMSGGGSKAIGTPPVGVNLLEPLVVRYVQMESNGRSVLNPPNDGINSTEITFEVSFGDDPVPNGTKIEFSLVYGDTVSEDTGSSKLSIEEINALPEEQRRIYYGGFTSYSELLDAITLESSIEIVREEGGKGLVVATINPTKIQKDVQFTIEATSTYDALGTINRSVTEPHVIFFRGKPDPTDLTGTNVYEASVERYDVLSDTWDEIDQMNEGRSGHFSEYDAATGKLYVGGGINNSGMVDDVEEFTYLNVGKTPVSGSYGSWVVQSGTMTYPRAYCQSSIKDSVIYALGGFGFNPFGTTYGLNAVPLCEKYDISSDTWTVLAEMPVPISHGSAQLIGDNIYVFSGLRSLSESSSGHTIKEFNNAILKYSITDDEWTVLDELDTAYNLLKRVSPFSYIKDGKIYVFGGIRSEYNAKSPQDALMMDSLVEIDLSDEDNILLTEISYSGDPIDRFRGGSCVLVGGDFYVSGGSGNKKITISGEERLIGTDTLRALEKLDTSTNTWTTYGDLSKMTKERHSLKLTSDGDYLYATGGVSSGYEAGKLIIDLKLSSYSMRANGREQISVSADLKDVTGEPAPDGIVVNLNGFVLISVGDEENAEQVDSLGSSKTIESANQTVKQLSDRVSVYPVAFSSSSLATKDGIASSIALARSEDPLTALSFLYQYTSGKDDVIGRVYDEDSGYALAPQKTEFLVDIGVTRDLYSIMIEASIEDSFYFGSTDTEKALESNADLLVRKSIDSTAEATDVQTEDVFSLSASSPKFQQESPVVNVYSDLGWIPHVDSSYGIMTYSDFVDKIDLLEQKIPFGGSPHWDAIVEASQEILRADLFRGLGKIVIDLSDNEENMSVNSSTEAIDQVHLVEGYQNTPIFTNSFILATPPSLSARRGRSDTVDLERIAGETGGLSHTILDDSYLPIVVRRIKIGSVGAIGSGTYTQIFDLGSVVTVTDITANFELYSYTDGWAEMHYSEDGFSYTEANDTAGPNVTESVSFKARYLKFVIHLVSEFGDADLSVPVPSPAFLDITFGYSEPRQQYVYTYATTADSFVRQMAVTVNGNVPLSSEVEVGITNSSSVNWNDYSSDHQRLVGGHGRIVVADSSLSLLNLSGSISTGGNIGSSGKTRSEIEDEFISEKEYEYGKVIDRIIVAEEKSSTSDGSTQITFADDSSIIIDEAPDYRNASDVVQITTKDQTKYNTSGTVLNYNFLNSEDGYLYYSSYGEWQPESVINVYRNGVVVPSTEYVSFQNLGLIKFYERQDLLNNVAIEVTLSPKFRVGIGVTNRDSRYSAVLDEFAYMYNANYVRSGELFNGSPSVSGLTITPQSAVVTDTFVASYTYQDPNDIPELGSVLTWYLNDGEVLELENKKSWSNSSLLKKNLNNGDKIYFTVRPSNGAVSGPLAVSASLFIGDTPPVVSNLEIIPILSQAIVSAFTSSVDLGVGYTYSDSRGRAESGTVIEWFINGSAVSFSGVGDPKYVRFIDNNYNTTDGDDAIIKGNYLKVRVTPSNGITQGDVYESAEVVITNSAPVLSNVALTPSSPTNTSVLTVSYDFFDRDDDADLSAIRWYRDGELIETLNDRYTVSSEFTSSGESWFAEITPSDGETDGEVIRTSVVTIK